MSEELRHLHPLTPVLRGWKVFAAVVAIAVQQTYGDVELGVVLVVVAASIPVGAAYGYLSWRATHYRIGREELLLETGVLFRRSRTVRLDRLQAVDVVRPLVARALGLAELRLEVAGGSSSEAPLAYLSESGAHELRAELLARAAGLERQEGAAAPVAPERVLLKVPLSRLVESQLRSGVVVVSVLGGLSLLVVALLTRDPRPLGFALPFLLASGPAAFTGIAGQFDFTIAESPDGLRLRRGLLETRAQTVPPGRVQAVRIREPLLWRSKGWCRVEINVAGYAGEGQQQASVLLPVAPLADALAVLRLVYPGVDPRTVPLAGVPAGARWLDPLQWRFLGAGSDDRVFVARRGRLTRETDVVLHEKVQSVRLVQGRLQRALGLASLHLDTTPGPVRVDAAHRDAPEARRMLDHEVTIARQARATARPDRWMRPAGGGTAPTVTAVTPAPHGVAETDGALDLGDPRFLADPYPTLAALRERSPVMWHEQTGQWLALSYEHANQVLRDRRLGRLWTDKQPADRFEPFNLLHRNQMMENEPPEHTRLRSLVASAFARGHVERLRPRVQEMCDALLAQVDPVAGFDLIADYAEPLPVAVIAELLGVPDEDRHLLRPWSADIVAMYEYRRTPETEERAVASAAAFADYMRGLAEARRSAPQDDLVSHLVAAEEQGDKLSGDELVASAILLLNAGHEASVNAFGNGMRALLERPDQLERLRSDPAVVEPAVEEMLRFDSPLQLFERTAKEDVAVGDVVVPAGRKVAALLGAANRDPAVFPDADTFDVTRTPNRHIAFGAGLHHCLGAPLARMELQISLPTLLRHCPRLELTGEPVRRPTFVLRGYESVPVRSTT
ncbi:MAG TPA: cytochrome P450 [Actinomycetes bacterium]|nr:cytochrome P450 [Actinomycetes bacterium]